MLKNKNILITGGTGSLGNALTTKLLTLGVKTIRIVDEMFLLNPKFYLPLCKMLAERNVDDSLRMWAYSRIDTIRRF